MPTVVTSTIGSGGDYTTLQAWEDAIDANLVTSDEQHVGECFDQTFNSGSNILTIAGHTTDATRNIILTTNGTASFKDKSGVRTTPLLYNAANGTAITCTTGYVELITLDDPNVTIRGLQISHTGSGGGEPVIDIQSGATGCEIDKCIIRSARTMVLTDPSAVISNCLFQYYGGGTGVSGGSGQVKNNTFVNPGGTAAGVGLSVSYGTIVAQNCALFNLTTVFTTGPSGSYSGSSHNATNAASAPGTSNQTSLTTANQFESHGPVAVVATTNNGNSGGNATSHVINMPASVAVGDLVLVFFSNDGSDTVSVSSGTGWAQLFSNANGTAARLSGYWKIATGSGDNLTLDTSGSQGSAHVSYRITGHAGLTPTVGTAATGSSANPNPPSVTPSYGLLDTLWIVCYGWDGNVAHTSYPANYSGSQVTDRWANANGCGVAVATRANAVATEDPGTATIGSEDWIANTVAIAPLLDLRAIDTGDLQAGTPDSTYAPDDISDQDRDDTTPWIGVWEIVAGGVEVTPAAASAVAGNAGPTVELSSVSITPAAVAAIGERNGPTVQLGSLSLTPAAAAAVGATVDPSVLLGSLTATPAAASAIGATVDPSIAMSSISVTPAAAFAVTAIVDPTVQLGSLSLTPAAASAVVTTVDPTVDAGGGVSVSPAAAAALGATVDPSVSLSSISVTPAAAFGIGATVNPTVQLGSLSLTPAPAAAVGTALLAQIVQSAISVTPAPASSIGETLLGSALLGSIVITPAPAFAVGSVVDPTVEIAGVFLIFPGAVTVARVGHTVSLARVGHSVGIERVGNTVSVKRR